MYNEKVNLKKHLGQILYYKYVIIITTLLVMTVVVFTNKIILKDQYRVTALVSVVSPSSTSTTILNDESYNTTIRIFREEILGRPVLEEVIADHNLLQREEDYKSGIQQFFELLGIEVRKKPITKDSLITYFRKKIEITEVGVNNATDRSDYLFSVSLLHNDPVFASKVVNAIINTYIKSKENVLVDKSKRTTEILDLQIEGVEIKIQELSEKMDRFKEANALYLIPVESLSADLHSARTLMVTVQGSIRELTERIKLMKSTLVGIPEYITSTEDEDTTLSELYSELAALEQIYTPKNLLIVNKKAQIEAVKKSLKGNTTVDRLNPEYLSIQREVNDAVAQLASEKAQLQLLQRQVDNLNSRMAITPTKIGTLEKMITDYTELMSQLTIFKTKRVDHNILSDTSTTVGKPFRIIEEAIPQYISETMSRLQINIGGMVAGLGLGLLLVFLIIAFNNENKVYQSTEKNITKLVRLSICFLYFVFLCVVILIQIAQQTLSF
jgi:uncharacterized protein involved in exopolysaccharide biosynthesis